MVSQGKGGVSVATTFDIGGNVRRLREARGISLSALARMAGVSKAYLSQMENDPPKRPSVEIVYQLAQALGVRLTELIGIDEEAPNDASPRRHQPQADPPGNGQGSAGSRTGPTGPGHAADPTAPRDGISPNAVSRAAADIDPGQLPTGLRIFWAEHPHLPLEDIRLLASVAQGTASGPLSPTDYWLLYETIQFLRRPRPRKQQRSMPA